ncbi:Lrp/AsnC family transcriptional regulator [Microbacterium azadirachtae]|uniref:Lrp/AsnC family transcriptional regulator, regulator for asnA, asnC and gidA n=1 Tax=Microbacterium azadirachtae TaxID=582680 RepID=A0A1I6G6K7_9MICO|nr:AsnC family transcriptional regulator [Microbacterium azadirachtae]SDL35823.1 Lrp/AsnC family transcriptional regulator, regulator for asnA, asnC and gidA [Microbacterium azadirachtae]SEF66556.1 Lrp/AsnC family transcriptional regulator, regulator for asnA, asnC and gidA [Microbacterium azadirachtae]SEF67320.1 Lrp/AsnC family transcriptional regulator, regulator for asnA, asnC and gidA [Microbacterium azadirachtae]SFR37826.1 Lrp/AsnC family transcriptional regulator, regulator for asnA, asnC
MSSSATDPHDDVDDIDHTLLAALQRDGRTGYAELGELVGLTAGGARKRVKRLEDRGILQIVGVTDPLRLGYRTMAMVGIVADGDVDEIATALNEMQDVVYVVLTAGRFDLLVEVIATDPGAVFELINQKIRSIHGVARAETFTYYGIRTHRFEWGTR